MIITVYATGFIQDSALPPKIYLTIKSDKKTIKNTGNIGYFWGINIPINKPWTTAVKSKIVFVCLILLLVNSAQTDAKIEIAIKITDEKALLISSNKICGINKHNIVIEIVVKDGVKKENGAIVKSL